MPTSPRLVKAERRSTSLPTVSSEPSEKSSSNEVVKTPTEPRPSVSCKNCSKSPRRLTRRSVSTSRLSLLDWTTRRT